MGKNKDVEQMEALQALIDQCAIDEVLGVVKSGKEATVYSCTSERHGLLAAKVYRSRDVRGFANDSVYNAGRLRQRTKRETRAIENKSRLGRQLSFGKWVADEYETLTLLHRAGVAVPRPILVTDSIILMEYVGDEDEAAAPLSSTYLEGPERQRVFDVVMRNVEAMLVCDRVHGDLSPYNVLYHDGDVRIIDLPQAVDARFNPNALELLERDVENICNHFARYGIASDWYRISHRLWSRYLRSEL